MTTPKTVVKAFKFKAYPNKTQERMIALNIDARTKAWNLCLELHDAYYALHRKDPDEEMSYAHSVLHAEGQKQSLSFFDLTKMITTWKRTSVQWFKEADLHAVRSGADDLIKAFDAFFRRVKEGDEDPGYPQYRKRRGTSYRTNNTVSRRNGKVYNSIRVIDNAHILIPKVGSLKCRGNLDKIQGDIKTVTVKKCPSGRYEISVCCTNVPMQEMPEGTADVIGVRVAVSGVARSDGIKIENPKAYKKAEKKLRREQRRLSRMQYGSKNYEKQRKRKARVEERIRNMRDDHVHKVTKQIVRDAKAVSVGRPKVKTMTKKVKGDGRSAQRKRNRATLDSAMYMTVQRLKYKSEWNGRGFVELEGGIPWTRTCCVCGEETGPTRAGVKSWTCPSCGSVHDTADNAARNIMYEGVAELQTYRK